MAGDPPLVARARWHADRTAIICGPIRCTYRELDDASQRVASALGNLREARVAFLVTPGFHQVAVQWGIWRAGGIAVPLALSHPPPELAYVIDDAGAAIVVADPSFEAALAPLAAAAGARFTTTLELFVAAAGELPAVVPDSRAMMLYTSGTTGRPKGVVLTHAKIMAQVDTLINAWEWRPVDRTLLVLPLHHVHGLINVVSCALAAGATCEMHARFDAGDTWSRLASGELTVFMAVPTIYHRLIAAWDAAKPLEQRTMSEGCRHLRLMVSGSAALPVRTLERWREISGHVLLERYGMTEIGMALANPLHGERRAGFVGSPLPGVSVRLVNQTGEPVEPGSPGEIEVRGPGVFNEYWQRPDATRAAFRDGWFRTGDMASFERGMYRILGRTSVDIIKTGGHKVSALEIEEVLRTHPAVAECAVVAVPDAEWGERVCAAVELRPAGSLELDELQAWAKSRLAPYKTPRALLCVAVLPRNAMGKVVKPDVAALFVRA